MKRMILTVCLVTIVFFLCSCIRVSRTVNRIDENMEFETVTVSIVNETCPASTVISAPNETETERETEPLPSETGTGYITETVSMNEKPTEPVTEIIESTDEPTELIIPEPTEEATREKPTEPEPLTESPSEIETEAETEPAEMATQEPYSEPATEPATEAVIDMNLKTVSGTDLESEQRNEKIALLCDDLKNVYYTLVRIARNDEIISLYRKSPKGFDDNYCDYLMDKYGIKYRDLFYNEEYLIKISFDDYDYDQIILLSELVYGNMNSDCLNIDVPVFISRFIQFTDLQKEYQEIVNSVVSEGMTEHDAVIAIARYLCSILSYQSGQQFPEKALETGKANCMAYSNLFKNLCEKVGIEVDYLNGYSNRNGEGAHAWNGLFLDGNYYYIDVTFMDAYGDKYGLSEKLWEDHVIT